MNRCHNRHSDKKEEREIKSPYRRKMQGPSGNPLKQIRCIDSEKQFDDPAGKKGKELEKFFNTELTAMMIYDASCPDFKINPARFYDSNEDALADMRKLAEGKP